MATITIKTGYLEDLADYADNVKGAAQKASNYWDKLNTLVVQKIDSYSGVYTGNISSARSNVTQYMSGLFSLESAFVSFAQNVRTLKEKAENLESSVIRIINNDLRAFCDKHGLEFNESDEEPGFWASLWASVCNFCYSVKQRIENFIEKFKEWYHYDGGKEIIEGVLAVVLVITAIVIAILAFPATLAALTGATIAGLIWGCIVVFATVITITASILNAVVKIGYAIEAVSEASQDHYFDAAWAAKKRDEGKFSEWMRDQGWYDAANVFDAVETIAMVVTFINSFGQSITKAKDFIHNFSLKGFMGDFVKNTKDFFKDHGFARLFFGGKYDGNFFGGSPLDVAKRMKTVLTVVDSSYRCLTYHDATGNKSAEKVFWERLETTKPIIDLTVSNYLDSATTRRHDMVTDPKSKTDTGIQTYTDSNGKKVTVVTTEQNIIDASTGKVTGKERVTVVNNADGSTTTTKHTEYNYTNRDGTGEHKIISEIEHKDGDGSKSTYTNTTTTNKNNAGDLLHKKDYTSTSHSETIKNVSADGSESSETKTYSKETKTDGGRFRAGKETSNTYSRENITIDKSKQGSSITKTNSSSQTGTYREGWNSGNAHSSQSSNSISVEMDGDKGTTKVQAQSSTEKSSENYSKTGKTNSSTKDFNVSKTTTPQKKTDTSPNSTKTTPSKKPTVISEKVSTQSRPNLPSQISSWDKTAGKLNSIFHTDIPTSDKAPEWAQKPLEYVKESGSAFDTAKNIWESVNGEVK